MANYNKVILMGNLTRDPQMSYLPSQTPVVEIGMAVNRQWRDKASGEKREEVCFVDCRAYGKQAETLSQYVKKGSPLLIEGRLQLDAWEGKDGTKRSKHRVVVENFQFLGRAEDDEAPAPRATTTKATPADREQHAREEVRDEKHDPTAEYAADGEGIPF